MPQVRGILALFGEETGPRLDTATLADLGQAHRVISRQEETTIVEGKGHPSEVQARISQIKAQMEETTSDYDREHLQERLAKLSGGVALIKVGANTEVELKYLKSRVEDALAATRAAVEEGEVPGGGVALLNAIPSLESLHLQGDTATGVQILRRALEEPMGQIALNSGYDGGAIVEGVRRAQKEHHNDRYGYDVLAERYEDMIASGIIDPAKVTRSALQNAASIAAMILTTDTLVTDVPESEQPAVPALAG